MTERTLAETERALLGLILHRGGDALDAAAKIISGPDFYHPFHEQVWDAAATLHESGDPIGPVPIMTMMAKLNANNRYEPTQILDIQSAGSTAAGESDWYAQQVADAADRRRLASAATKIQLLAENEGISTTEASERARQALDDACSGRTTRMVARLRDVLDDVLDAAEKKESPALSTGWIDLDNYIGGMAPGRLVVVGARPGLGKSVTGTNLALQMAGIHKHTVLIASAEMNREEVVQRMLAADASINIKRLIDGALEEREWDKIRGRYNEIQAMPVFIHDESTMTVSGIRTAARDIKRERDDLALIIVDYLQLMENTLKAGNRAEAIGHISRGLKVLARETNSCVVAMAQINRESLKNVKPRMSDLRESGAIEADANQVILLHRPDDDLPDVEFIVDKNRHGPTGTAVLMFEGHYARFRNRQWTPTRSIT